MTRAGALCLAFCLIGLVLPGTASADYLYPGSAALQALAVMEPATPDSLFHAWTGDLEQGGRQNLGISLDFLRNADNADDWDVVFAATGSFRSGKRLLLGLTAPYIIRDPEFNESELLDLRLFARMRLLGSAPSLRVTGEISAVVPTASEGDPYPFTLDSTIVGGRLAFAGGSRALRTGAFIGYQSYLATESGDDADLLYGLWTEKDLRGPWSVVGEFTGSRHTHGGAPGDDDVTDSYFQVGVRRAQSERLLLGLAAGSGIGGDAAADMRVTAVAIYRFGTVKEAVAGETRVEKEPVKAPPAPAPKARVQPYMGIVVVMIAEGVAARDLEKRVTRALQQKGYATGMDPSPGVKVPRKNILYYNPGMQEQAIAVSRMLVMGGHLKDLQVEESPKPLTQNWLLLIPGGGK